MNIGHKPIGIFDSGIGGLTVAHAVARLLPHEDIVYFGDTAHLPYGDKSTAAIQAYSVKIADLLLNQKCKVILIACHSASAAAFELMQEYVGKQALVINVISPVIEYLRKHAAKKAIGLIGTKQTVNSNIYKKMLDELNLGIVVNALATPLLAPMIEEGYCQNKIMDDVIHDYLQNQNLQKIHALVLACTHYPLIKQQIAQYYRGKVDIIDPSLLAADALKSHLELHHLLNQQNTPGRKHFYISDYTDSFAKTAELFFQEQLKIEHYPLWE